MNAFTQKPDVSWLKKQQTAKKISEALSKKVKDPSTGQRRRLSNILEKK